MQLTASADRANTKTYSFKISKCQCSKFVANANCIYKLDYGVTRGGNWAVSPFFLKK